ncbi:hypothetical protein [Lactiplantibacillus garii]|uniref:hypothetical protein n=1 Tax=Lactiplantibacillus garii TaxID=2306423 RepID=UPI000F62A4D7|nr:hypothetical protein [Lactiplantibacillus garii]
MRVITFLKRNWFLLGYLVLAVLSYTLRWLYVVMMSIISLYLVVTLIGQNRRGTSANKRLAAGIGLFVLSIVLIVGILGYYHQ